MDSARFLGSENQFKKQLTLVLTTAPNCEKYITAILTIDGRTEKQKLIRGLFQQFVFSKPS